MSVSEFKSIIIPESKRNGRADRQQFSDSHSGVLGSIVCCMDDEERWSTRLRQKMQRDWDQRARENALYYVATGSQTWDEEDFFQSGEKSIGELVLNDMINICGDRSPLEMRVLEIGCGVGRITRALAQVFGEVHGVDVSGEMISRARHYLRSTPNAFVYQNNGVDLSALEDLSFDFAFSYLVFQHISSKEVVEDYVQEVHRVLKPGRLFKFQVLGQPPDWSDCHLTSESRLDTWVGVFFSEQEMVEMAERCGFERGYSHGAGSEDFWLWFFKRPS